MPSSQTSSDFVTSLVEISDLDHPPGFPRRFKKAVPLPEQRFQHPDLPKFSTVKFCSQECYESIRSLGVFTQAHSSTNCDCFLSFYQPNAGWPSDELELHYAASKVLLEAINSITPIMVDLLLREVGVLQAVATSIIIDYPYIVDEIEAHTGIGEFFGDQQSQRQFIEFCIVFYVVYQVFKQRELRNMF